MKEDRELLFICCQSGDKSKVKKLLNKVADFYNKYYPDLHAVIYDRCHGQYFKAELSNTNYVGILCDLKKFIEQVHPATQGRHENPSKIIRSSDDNSYDPKGVFEVNDIRRTVDRYRPCSKKTVYQYY